MPFIFLTIFEKIFLLIRTTVTWWQLNDLGILEEIKWNSLPLSQTTVSTFSSLFLPLAFFVFRERAVFSASRHSRDGLVLASFPRSTRSLVLIIVTVETHSATKMADVHVGSYGHLGNNVLSGTPSPLPRPYLPSLPPTKTIKPSYSRWRLVIW